MDAATLLSQLRRCTTIVEKLPDTTWVGLTVSTDTIALHVSQVANGPECLRALGATRATSIDPGCWLATIDGLRVYATESSRHDAQTVAL